MYIFIKYRNSTRYYNGRVSKKVKDEEFKETVKNH